MDKGIRGSVLTDVNIKLELFDEKGVLKEVREVHNATTTLGKEVVADQLLAAPTVAKPG